MRTHFSRRVLEMADALRLGAWKARGARSARVSSAVGPLHLLDVSGAGRLPPVVLLHGLSSCALDFGALIAGLRPQVRRILAIDLPAHGRSGACPRSSASDVLEALGDVLAGELTEPAVVFGNSLGGLAAIRFALAHPDHTAALFLASPAGAATGAREREALMDRLNVGDRRRARAFVGRALPSVGRGAGVLAWAVRARLDRPEIQGLLHLASSAELRGPELAALRMPITLWWGTEERLLPASHLRFFVDRLPAHAVVERPAGLGHVPSFEAPERVVTELRRLASAAGRRQTSVRRPPVRSANASTEGTRGLRRH